MAATCMAVCKGSRKKIRGIFISSCHLPVAVECDIVILSEPGPIPQAPVGQFCRHNLSPRGDGNGIHQFVCLENYDTTYPREGTETVRNGHGLFRVRRTQLIPARGRKHRPVLRQRPGDWDTTYPREGTETQPWRCCQAHDSDTTYPREGTETRAFRVCINHLLDTTYPREGTETERFLDFFQKWQ